MERDLADDLDDLICSGPVVTADDGSSFKSTAIFLLSIWVALAVMVFSVVNYVLKPSSLASNASEVAGSEAKQPETKPESTPLVIQSNVSKHISPTKSQCDFDFDAPVENGTPYMAQEAPKTFGSDLDAVDWGNKCFESVFESPSISSTIFNLWLDALSNYTKSTGVEVRQHYTSSTNYASFPCFSRTKYMWNFKEVLSADTMKIRCD